MEDRNTTQQSGRQTQNDSTEKDLQNSSLTTENDQQLTEEDAAAEQQRKEAMTERD